MWKRSYMSIEHELRSVLSPIVLDDEGAEDEDDIARLGHLTLAD
jgi:hypothetical protein